MPTRGTIHHHGVTWRTPNIHDSRSPPFTVRNMQCHLVYDKEGSLAFDYRLHLCSNDPCDEPFDLFVELIVGRDRVSSFRTTYPGRRKIVWRGHTSEISEIVPDFDGRELVFRIKVLDDNTTAACSAQGLGVGKSVQTATYVDAKFELDNLSWDLAKLLEDEDSSHRDVELVCGERTWKAHGSLLSARSDVFKSMLQSDMLEAGRVEIRDMEPDTFQEFLRYVYTGSLSVLNVEMAMRLYEIGERYSVAGIKEMCASFLTDHLAKDNACQVLSLADQHNDQAFKESVMSYVVNHKIPFSECWSDFSKAQPQLAFEVHDRILKLHIDKFKRP